MNKQKLTSFLSLFTSFSTLLCCALPSLLVVLGLGPLLASLIGIFPGITIISEHKTLVFSVTGLILAISGWLQYKASSMMCPLDQKENCTTTKSWSRKVYWISVSLYLVGGTMAFIVPRFS